MSVVITSVFVIFVSQVSQYEAVHPLRHWRDLKHRVGPNRRCFVFTHRAFPREPIVILHAALTREPASSVQVSYIYVVVKLVFPEVHECMEHAKDRCASHIPVNCNHYFNSSDARICPIMDRIGVQYMPP